MPVTTLSSPPSASFTPPITSICQSQGPQAFPAAAVLSLSAAPLRLDQALPNVVAIDGGAARKPLHPLTLQTVADDARAHEGCSLRKTTMRASTAGVIWWGHAAGRGDSSARPPMPPEA